MQVANLIKDYHKRIYVSLIKIIIKIYVFHFSVKFLDAMVNRKWLQHKEMRGEENYSRRQ